jgi:hypothetical protein
LQASVAPLHPEARAEDRERGESPEADPDLGSQPTTVRGQDEEEDDAEYGHEAACQGEPASAEKHRPVDLAGRLPRLVRSRGTWGSGWGLWADGCGDGCWDRRWSRRSEGRLGERDRVPDLVFEHSRGDVDGVERGLEASLSCRLGRESLFGARSRGTFDKAQVLRRRVDQSLGASARVALREGLGECEGALQLGRVTRDEGASAGPLERPACPSEVS